jgi:type IV pilus assembly protein PilQ
LQADVRTNRIFLQDTPRQINLVNQFIHEMDVPVPQIDIEVKLASVDYDYERDLGLTFMQTSPDESASTETQGQSRYSLAIAHLPGSALLTVKLAALENAGHAELISSPSLFTANQETASIEAGEEVPYQEVSQSGGTAVVFKKAVLGLKVTPQLLPDKKVLLQLQINQDRPNNKTVLGMPTISTRQIISHVLVKHGQTIVLGGIYELDTQNAEERVPFLSNLPGIGLLFKQQNIKKRKRELLIFVTPKVIA